MKHAFLIAAYKDPIQLQRLVGKLSKIGDVYIHINKKVNINPFYDIIQNSYNSVFFSVERFRISWGGWNIIPATFSMMNQALSNKQYDRFTFLTGLDYPIKPMSYIEDFFKKNADKDFVYGEICSDVKRESLREFFLYDHTRIEKKILSMAKKLLPSKLFVVRPGHIDYNGKQYQLRGLGPKWSLCGESAHKILDFYENNPKINKYFKYMHSPDDIYLPTIYNVLFDCSQLSEEQIFYHLTEIGILDENNYTELISSPCLFARKFDSDVSAKLLLKMEYNNDSL